jgi:hypothetical protein
VTPLKNDDEIVNKNAYVLFYRKLDPEAKLKALSETKKKEN